MDKMRMESPDLTTENIEKIGELFPNCVTESTDENGKLKKAINFDILRQMLSKDVIAGDEAYEFSWVGKKASIAEANKPIRKTLRPCLDESVDWDKTENLYIEGENLEVLKLLQEGYLGKVKAIYIDPPYNTGNDFIYKDNFVRPIEDYVEEIGQYDEMDNRLFRNTDSNGRFHSDWCSMIFPRLILSRNLLSDDGVICISVDRNEMDSLVQMGKEVFGEKNYIATLVWKSRQNKDNRNLTGVSEDHEYIVVFSRNSSFRAFKGSERNVGGYKNPDNDPRGPWTSANMVGLLPEDQRPNCHYDLINPVTGINYGRPTMGWRYDKNTMNRLISENRIIWPESPDGRPRRKVFLNELTDSPPGYSSIIGNNIYTRNGTKEIEEIFGQRYFEFPKPSDLILELLEQITKKDSLVVDFFSGSATTAQAVMRLNAKDQGCRKFILVQLPEACDSKSSAFKNGFTNICEIGKERIRRSGIKIKEENPLTTTKLDIGFRVFKLDESNMENIYYSADEYDQNMLTYLQSNIKPDRTDLDILFGCLLEWGLPLSMPYYSEKIEGYTIHTYNDGDLIACFDENISESVIMEIADRHPLRVVFRDSSFSDSPSKINVWEHFKLLSPETRVKVI